MRDMKQRHSENTGVEIARKEKWHQNAGVETARNGNCGNIAGGGWKMRHKPLWTAKVQIKTYSVVCPCLHVFNNRRLSILCLSRIFMSRIFHPLQHCATVSVSRSFHPCILGYFGAVVSFPVVSCLAFSASPFTSYVHVYCLL